MPLTLETPKERSLQTCLINLECDQRDGSPAPFATVDIFEVRYFLWWPFYVWVTSTTLNFYGKGSVYLTRDKTYQFKFKWQSKVRETYRKPSYCPYYVGVVLP